MNTPTIRPRITTVHPVGLDELCPTCDLPAHGDGDHAVLGVDGTVLRTWPRSTTHHRDCDCIDCRFPD